MNAAIEALEAIQPYFFGGLALVALVQWRRRPGPPAAWLCSAFIILAIVVVAADLVSESSSEPAAAWVTKAMVALLVFFPYSLYRFMGSMIGQIRWIKVLALVLTLGLAATVFFLPSFPGEDDPRPVWFDVYIGLLLVQWVVLSSIVAGRLWRAGRGHPAVARHRMRTMSLGTVGLALALVVAGELSDGGVAALVVSSLALSAGPLMLIGFVPPYILRAWWRREEDASLTRAEHSLTETTSEAELAATLLSRARALLAAPSAWLEDQEGNVIARDPEVGRPGWSEPSGSDGTTSANPDPGFVVSIPMRSHGLKVAASPFMPFFGSEEIERLEHLAALADVALSRQGLVEDQRLLAAIVESSNDAIIAETLDGTITAWNRGAEEIYGYSAQEVVGKSVKMLVPDDLDDVEDILGRVQAGAVIEHYETRRRTKQGRVIDVSLSVSPLRDGSGGIVGASVVARDVTEAVRLRADLRDQAKALGIAREEAERANASKTEFLSRMSHELRTPLNAILGFTQLLEMDDLDPDQRESTTQIMRGGRRLLELINEVLDIARVESGQLTMSLESVPVDEAVRATVELIRPLAEERSIELAVDMVPGDLYVSADRQRLDQVLLNLLSNAVKYNVEGGKVTVHVPPPSDDTIRIGIRDTGPGVADEDIPRLFTPFDRLGVEESGVEGTGLGLALCKSLVEAMDGRIQVATGDGSGTTFWLELRASGPPVPKAAAATAPATAGSTAGPHTLLYIEDNLSNRRLIEQLLTHRPGVSLLAAMTGNLGLDLARQHSPDLVLLDLHLPDLEGAEVLARLRKDPRTQDVPVVILSADATPGQIKRFMAAGAHDYLTKPIDVPQFLAVLDRLLAKKESR